MTPAEEIRKRLAAALSAALAIAEEAHAEANSRCVAHVGADTHQSDEYADASADRHLAWCIIKALRREIAQVGG